MLLLLHIETTGLFRYDMPATADQQPHLVELECELCDASGKPVSPRRLFSETIRSSGWHSSAGATQVHGLTTRKIAREGLPETLALWALKSKIDEASAVVSYQGDFARQVVSSILAREKHDRAKDWLDAWNRPGLEFIDLGTFCTQLCKLDGERGFRRPKIDEAHRIITGATEAAACKLDMTRTIYAALREKQIVEAA